MAQFEIALFLVIGFLAISAVAAQQTGMISSHSQERRYKKSQPGQE
jgi:hypothetical protein